MSPTVSTIPRASSTTLTPIPRRTRDGSWYGGTPLGCWRKSRACARACFFWPGSEAEIDGERPTYYLNFDDHFPDEKRIEQVIAWLRLPAAQRPHLITLYYSNVDHAGHQYGPDSPQTAAAVAHVDESDRQTLDADLDPLQLPIDLIVVSDHGMEQEQGAWIDLDKYTDLVEFHHRGSLLYANSEAAAEKAYQELKIKSDAFTVYRRRRVPAASALRQQRSRRRSGDRAQRALLFAPMRQRRRRITRPELGVHGYDPRAMKSMRALFLAVGPDIRAGSKLEPFENVNMYPLVAKLLGLDPPQVDGTLNVLSKILKSTAEDDIATK